MKNKIKKILLLGMTAMFTAGAAGTAVISCPVWADEAEQNSETAEEPKAEDAAVEEKIADQTDDKTENTDLKTVEHPRMSAYSIRRFSIVKDGEEVFQIKQEPADYKMDFDYWEITNPYDETAEEPKAEDAAVEEKIADQTDDKTENTDLKTVEHPRMSAYSIRRFSIVKDGEEVFQIKQEPADYKMDFDYWEITNPYDETATVNTENMYEMFGVLAAFDLSNGVDAANTDTGLDNTKTYFTVDFVNTVNDDTAKETQDADATATILIGNTDENGDYYACVKGYEEAVYMLSKESVNSLLELKPFNLILKIPALVNIDTLDSVDMSIGKKTYTMKLDGSDYKFGKKTVKKEKFTELYQALQSIMLDSEVEETKDAADKEEVLTVTFHRNTEEAPEVTLKYFAYDDTYDSLEINGTERFLVKAEDVDALVKQIKKAF